MIPLSEVANLIKILQSCQGKVVFIGVGKSGIIARKLAATFASTGTASFFVSRYRSRYTATLGWWRKTMLLFLFQQW
ncbi:SIS domain-containing protein [Escherichia coli]